MQAVPMILAMAASLLVVPTPDATNAGDVAPGYGYGAAATSVQEPQEPIDVNTASEEQLELIPGIGPAMAQRIIAWREQNGPFERVEDLLNVRGIGTTTLEKLRPYVVVHPKSATRGR